MRKAASQSRRHFLQLLASGLATLGLAPQTSLASTTEKTVPYGAAVYLPDLEADPRLGQNLKKYCSRISPSAELKWDLLRKEQDLFDFSHADKIANFARQNAMKMHGHPLIWYASNGEWLEKVTSPKAVEHIMEDHISKVVQRYKDVVDVWDVVNEPIPDHVTSETSRRDAWYDRSGKHAIAKAFQLAHQADPKALLILNEYDVEFAAEKSPLKLKAYRNLILELLDKGAPIHGVGLQGHLRGNWPIAKHELSAFTNEMHSLGLKVLITELDVMDHELPRSIQQRDKLILAQVRDFLTAARDGSPLHAITTWGLSDQFSWIRWAYKRKDGTQNRPLPLDWDFNEKPLMALIDEFRR